MVPEGLVLLTSLAFAVAAVTLARRQVLVQELPAVEGARPRRRGLPRQDGHAHRGRDRVRRRRAARARRRPVHDGARRARRRPEPQRHRDARSRPRSPARRVGSAPRRCRSRRRGSGAAATFAAQGTWVLGAPEMVWVGRPADDPVRRRADELAAEGRRVLLLAHTDAPLVGRGAPRRARGRRRSSCSRRRSATTPPTRSRTSAAGRRAQGDLGRQPAHGRRGRAVGRPRRCRRRRSTPASFPKTSTRSPTCSSDSSVFGRVTPHQKRAIVRRAAVRGTTSSR